MSQLDDLMRPVSPDVIAGPDLAYDPKRQEIEAAFEAARLADRGEGEAPDWTEVMRLIKEQSSLTKDATLAVLLARAGARAQRLSEVELGSSYLAAMFETWWDEIHPSLQEYGFQGRKGVCESLVSIGDFLGPLRRIVLVSHPRLGQFTAEQIVNFANDGKAAENVGMFRAALADIDPAEIAASVTKLQEIRTALSRVDAVLTARAQDDTATNFAPAYEAIDSMHNALVTMTGIGAPPPSPATAEGSTEASAAVLAAGQVKCIESRADVVQSIENIIDYYSKHEPGSPIPLVLERAKAWVHMDFLSILNDINPTGAEDAKRVLQRREP